MRPFKEIIISFLTSRGPSLYQWTSQFWSLSLTCLNPWWPSKPTNWQESWQHLLRTISQVVSIFHRENAGTLRRARLEPNKIATWYKVYMLYMGLTIEGLPSAGFSHHFPFYYPQGRHPRRLGRSNLVQGTSGPAKNGHFSQQGGKESMAIVVGGMIY